MQNATPGPEIFSFQTKNQVSDKCGKTDLFERILSANGEERFRRRNIQPIADSPTKFKKIMAITRSLACFYDQILRASLPSTYVSIRKVFYKHLNHRNPVLGLF